MAILICFLLLVAVMEKKKKKTTKIILVKKGLISFYTSRSWSIPEVRQQEPEKDRTREKTLEPQWCLPAPSLAHAQLSFLHPLTSLPKMRVLFTVDWTLLNQSSIKTISHGHSHKPVWPTQSCNWGSMFPGDAGICQVDNKNLTSRITLIR